MSSDRSEPIRVLHVIETLGMGGAERVLVTLLPQLAAHGVVAEVAVLRPPYSLATDLEDARIAVHRMDSGSLWNLPRGGRAIARLAKQGGFDLVHAHLLFPTIYTALGRHWPESRFTSAATFHNLAYAPGANRKGPTYGLRKWLNRWAVNHGLDAKLAVSSAVAAHYAGALGGREIQVVHNPVDLDAVRDTGPAAVWPVQSSDGTLRLILPGRLVHEKGHSVLLDAVERLREAGRSVSTVFAGDGPLRQRLEGEIARRDLGTAVHITGSLPHRDLLALVKAADIVAVPSLYEGFGLTAAEALALGKPVVASRIGGLTDIIRDGETGLLVPANDATALAHAIARLADDAALAQRLAQAGRAYVETAFDSHAVAANHAAIYRRMLAARSSR